MSAQIQIRRDTAANWTTQILASGEFGLDTTNNQVKVGTGAAWNATAYLGATIPQITSVVTDFNDATLRITGRYLFASITGMTNGPAVPINIKVADGGISLLVITYGAIVVQQLWTDGDGTQPQKTYSRVYDTAYRAWVAQSAWAVDATEGVDLVAKSADIKDALTVGGVLAVADGTNLLPSITNTGDTNTGLYFSGADEVALTTNGAARLVARDAAVTIAPSLIVNGTISASTNRIINVGAATAITDALSWTMAASAITFFQVTLNSTTTAAPDGSTWTVAGLDTTSNITVTSSYGAAATYQCLAVIFTSTGLLHRSNVGLTAAGVFTIPLNATATNSDSILFIAFRRA